MNNSDLEYESIAWQGLGNVAGENAHTSVWNDLSENNQDDLTFAFQSVNENCQKDDCK